MTAEHSPAYKRSAGVVVVRQTGATWRVLCLRAFRYWDFPKGLVDPGEDPLAAAIREVAEEAGLANLEFRWGAAFCETEPYARGKVARYYVAYSPDGEVRLEPNPALGRPEHDEYRWLEFDAAYALLAPRLQKVLNWAGATMGANGRHLSPSSSSSSS
jgi:bis(5'-nucleosidyl)-tetraphosphatase